MSHEHEISQRRRCGSCCDRLGGPIHPVLIMDAPQAPSIAALSKLPVTTARTVVHVLGQNAPGDGGDNLYSSSLKACASTAARATTTLKSRTITANAGFFHRRSETLISSPCKTPTRPTRAIMMFLSAWLAALQSSKRCGHWNAGTYKFQNPIDVDMGSAYSSGVCIRGDGVHLTLIDMTNVSAGSVPPVQLTALPFNNANCDKPTNCGTTANPSIGFYFKFQDIGVYGNIATAPLFSIGTPTWTDQLNWVDVRAWVSNASPSAAAVAAQVGVTASGNSIELIANNGGHGVGVNVTAATMTDFRISGCNCDEGFTSRGQRHSTITLPTHSAASTSRTRLNDVYIDGIYGGQILFLSGDFSYRNGGAVSRRHPARSGERSFSIRISPRSELRTTSRRRHPGRLSRLPAIACSEAGSSRRLIRSPGCRLAGVARGGNRCSCPTRPHPRPQHSTERRPPADQPPSTRPRRATGRLGSMIERESGLPRLRGRRRFSALAGRWPAEAGRMGRAKVGDGLLLKVALRRLGSLAPTSRQKPSSGASRHLLPASRGRNCATRDS